MLHTLSDVVLRSCKVCWKFPTLADSTMSKTSKSNHLGLISSRLKSPVHQIVLYFLERFLSLYFQFCDNLQLATSNLIRSAPSEWISKFDPLFDASGSVLSSALWFGTVRAHLRAHQTFFLEMGGIGGKMWEYGLYSDRIFWRADKLYPKSSTRQKYWSGVSDRGFLVRHFAQKFSVIEW